MSTDDKALEAKVAQFVESLKGDRSGYVDADDPSDMVIDISGFDLMSALRTALVDAWAEGHAAGRADEWSLEPNPYRGGE